MGSESTYVHVSVSGNFTIGMNRCVELVVFLTLHDFIHIRARVSLQLDVTVGQKRVPHKKRWLFLNLSDHFSLHLCAYVELVCPVLRIRNPAAGLDRGTRASTPIDRRLIGRSLECTLDGAHAEVAGIR